MLDTHTYRNNATKAKTLEDNMNSKTTAANNHAPRPAVAPADTITLLVFKGFSA